MSNPTVPILQPRLVYGLRTDIKGNVNFISDDEVLYPAGGLLVMHNFAQKRQRFARLPDKGLNITRIVVSPNQYVLPFFFCGERYYCFYCKETVCYGRKRWKAVTLALRCSYFQEKEANTSSCRQRDDWDRICYVSVYFRL